MGDLLPNEVYFLKWVQRSVGEDRDSLLVLKGEFLKYYDNRYREDYLEYEVDGEEPSRELFGSILNDAGEPIPYDFENPLYPYNHFKRVILDRDNPANVGLFRIISIEKCKNWGKDSTIRYSVIAQTRMSAITIKNTRVIGEGTLLWVDLDEVREIRDAFNKRLALEEKAVEATPLPDDIKREELSKHLDIPRRRRTIQTRQNIRTRRGKYQYRGGKSKSSRRRRGGSRRRRLIR